MADRSPRQRGRRVLWIVAALAGLAMVTVVGTVLALDRSLDRVDVDGLGESADEGDEDDPPASGRFDDASAVGDPQLPEAEDEPTPDALTVLVLGSDSREVLTEEERRELGTGDAWGERTETIALVRLDPEADRLRMLSVPRDTLITRCDGSRGRVNAAYAIGERNGVGGMTCVVETLRDWLDVTIDHTMKVDFRGFVDIVDALDGVPMEIDEPIRDRRANLDLDAGCNRLDGAEALAFVRARSIDDDFGRMARQQRLVEEMRRELASVGVFDELPRLLRTVDAIAGSVELDSGLTLNRLQQLARQHRRTVSMPLDGRSIPGVIVPSDGIAFLEVEHEDALEKARWLERGTEPGADDADGGSADVRDVPGSQQGTVPDDADGADETPGNGDPTEPADGDGTGPGMAGGLAAAGDTGDTPTGDGDADDGDADDDAPASGTVPPTAPSC